MAGTGNSIVPSHMNGDGDANGNHELQPRQRAVEQYNVRHGMHGNPRVRIAWGTGNCLRLSFLPDGEQRWSEAGMVAEVKLGPEVEDGAEERRIASASLPIFAMLMQSRRRPSADSPADNDGVALGSPAWENVLDYSKNISGVLESGGSSPPRGPPRVDEAMSEENLKPSATTRAVWDLLEIFYVDKGAESWLSERLVDWLLANGAAFSVGNHSLKSRLIGIRENLSRTMFPEDETDYWEAVASALAVGWLDFVVKLLRFHGSYRHDQIDDRQTENGLVEAVAVLVSKMPRLRPRVPSGEPGMAFPFRPEFAKEWERWRMQVTKLDRSAYWNECHHKKTLYGLRKLLEILQGNNEALMSATDHWIELFVANCLHVRPLAGPLDSLIRSARSCVESKRGSASPSAPPETLRPLILAAMAGDTEIVVAECATHFEPWLMAHIVELLKAGNAHARGFLERETATQGEISLEELYRLSYAQALASHPLTWQLAPPYLATCPRRGLGMLEALLFRLPVANDHRLALKALEICRLYDLGAVRAVLCRKVGVRDWKHGSSGSAIVWLQRARDDGLLSAISDHLLASLAGGRAWQHAESLEQMEALVDLLGSEFRAMKGGLSFLHRYRNFKSAMQTVREMTTDGNFEPQQQRQQEVTAAGRRAAACLTELFKGGITPKRFWMPLLRDSVELLEWPEQVLLDTKDTNLLLNCTQELRLAKLCGDVDNVELSGPAIDRVRLALATNLSRSLVQV